MSAVNMIPLARIAKVFIFPLLSWTRRRSPSETHVFSAPAANRAHARATLSEARSFSHNPGYHYPSHGAGLSAPAHLTQRSCRCGAEAGGREAGKDPSSLNSLTRALELEALEDLVEACATASEGIATETRRVLDRNLSPRGPQRVLPTSAG